MKKRKKWIIAIIVTVVVLTGAFFGYRLIFKEEQPLAMAPVIVEAMKGSIVVNVSGSGAVAPALKETVKAADGGKIKEFLVKEGDIVKKGQELLTYEGKDLAEEIKQEEIVLKQKLQDLEDLQRKLKEQARDGDVDDLKSSINRMNLDIETTQSRIQSFRKDEKAPSPLVAQADGEIVKLHAVDGDQVAAGANIADIVDYQHLEVVITVDELEIPKMKLGLPATIAVDALPGQIFQGQVKKIAKEGKAQNGVSTFDVTVGFDGAEGVLVGMTAQADVIALEKHDVIVVPIEAVQQGPGGNMVLIPGSAPDPAQAGGNGGAVPAMGMDAGMGGESRPVEIGVHNESMMEITSGLQEGDKVILPIMSPMGGGFPGGMRGNAVMIRG